ncbi:hypothetical protein [Geobacillus subterraneus]|uniref:Uncharacterized protein n=1 Tax=Geobacillus subterraneus TaxID=129338 RepID=A0A679FRD7_9BACL|nr:hypothetical protein [Geobacillus subterraneus]BBW97185.1 hypothetical protein GsuE55_20180 [Geobacillus subterraneus]
MTMDLFCPNDCGEKRRFDQAVSVRSDPADCSARRLRVDRFGEMDEGGGFP